MVKNNKIILICIAIAFLIIGISCVVYFSNNNDGDEFEHIDLVTSNGNQNETGNTQDKSEDKSEEENGVKDIEKMYIHIIGEINNPGVIELAKGSRIVDAIEKAGGATAKADLSKVNLVFILSDGQKVRIPSIDDNERNEYIIKDSGNNIIENSSYKSGTGGGKVNLNSASQAELETLTGIGPSLAERILEYRNKVGKFKKVDELKNVKGIGQSKVEDIKDEVVVD